MIVRNKNKKLVQEVVRSDTPMILDMHDGTIEVIGHATGNNKAQLAHTRFLKARS